MVRPVAHTVCFKVGVISADLVAFTLLLPAGFEIVDSSYVVLVGTVRRLVCFLMSDTNRRFLQCCRRRKRVDITDEVASSAEDGEREGVPRGGDAGGRLWRGRRGNGRVEASRDGGWAERALGGTSESVEWACC